MAYDKVVDSAKLDAGLTRIADAIRRYAPDPGPPRECEFPEGFVQGVADVHDAAIAASQDAVHDAFMQGLDEGYKSGFAGGIAAGKQEEWSTFWDNFQQNGTKTAYSYTFYGGGWTDTNFKPKYDIRATDVSQMFNGSGIKDVAGCLEQAGVVMDTSACAGFSYTFYNSKIEHLPAISTVGASKLSYTFYSMANLHTIDKLILKDDGSQTFDYTFYCPALVNLTIEGTIGNNLAHIGYSIKLSHDSLMSIINHLKDYAGTGTTKTLSIGTTNLGKLTADEKKIATDKGWTLA